METPSKIGLNKGNRGFSRYVRILLVCKGVYREWGGMARCLEDHLSHGHRVLEPSISSCSEQWERTDNSPRRSTRPEIMEFGASITSRKARTEPEHKDGREGA